MAVHTPDSANTRKQSQPQVLQLVYPGFWVGKWQTPPETDQFYNMVLHVVKRDANVVRGGVKNRVLSC